MTSTVRSPTVKIQDLPTDIILAFVVYLTSRDVLALQQTCRDLHAYISSAAYVWQTVARSQPFLLPFNRPLSQYDASELQNMIRLATCLDRNWRAWKSHVRAFSTIVLLGGVSIQDLRTTRGGEYAIALQRNRGSVAVLSLLCLRQKGAIWKMASVEVAGNYGKIDLDLSMADSRGVQSLRVVLTACVSGVETLQIFGFDLEASMRPHNTDIRPSYRAIEKPTDLPGMFDSIAVRGDIIASNVFSVVNKQTVVLYNLQTGQEQTYASPQQDNPHMPFSVTVHLSTTRVFILQRYADRITLLGIPHQSCARPITQHGTNYCMDLKTESVHFAWSSSVPGTGSDKVILYTFSSTGWAVGMNSTPCIQISTILFNVPTSGGSNPDLPSIAEELRRLITPQGWMCSTSHISAGAHRAVWIKHDWEREEYAVIKLLHSSVNDGKSISDHHTAELLAAVPELPVRPADVDALSFDEVCGRLCLGLYSGVVVVLDYGLE